MSAFKKTALAALAAWAGAWLALGGVPGRAQSADQVNGNLIQFSDNGGWCWYQDERVVVDTKRGEMAVASLANRRGVGGTPRDGDVDVAVFDLKTRRSKLHTLRRNLLSYGGGDDHNVAALMVRPAGGYLAVYTGHNNNKFSYSRIYNPASGSWRAEGSFNWNSQPGGADFQNSYSNLYFLSAENRTYNFSRGHLKSPNYAISPDQGATWTYGGMLTMPDASVGYVNGYFKYASNGVDRIDFTATEHHPRDFNTSIFHGYLKGGKSHNSAGTVIDANATDKSAPYPNRFTRVFAANTVMQGVTMTRCWNIDLESYPDGSLGTLFKCRANNSETDHRFIIAYYRNGQWSSSYLARAGAKLFGSEQDYTGLGVLHPNDPNVIYISTPVDPNTNAALGRHEIYRGTTTNNGGSWTWTAITLNSTRNNFRPVIPSWDKDHTALVWYRGTMSTSQNFDAAMVGLVLTPESVGTKTYVDASASNTTTATGGTLSATGPSEAMGAANNQWHWRSGYGNGGSVLASAESGGENAPTLRTRTQVAQAGTYDVWVNFWADPGADWRIQAGLSASEMQVYRHIACRRVEAGEYSANLVLTGGGNTQLYEAYLGRVALQAGGNLDVFVDDFAVQTGTQNTLIGNSARTWYDGISLAAVGGPTTVLERGASSRFKAGMDPKQARISEGARTLPPAYADIATPENLK